MRMYFIAKRGLIVLSTVAGFCHGQEIAPRNELGFTLGGIPAVSRNAAQQTADLGAGTAFGINYGRLIVSGRKVALYGEVDLLANPRRDVSSNSSFATQNVASLYVTPGIRVKVLPTSTISPFGVIGGGYALYEQSTTLLNGQPNPAPRELSRGTFDFGGGVDVHVWRWLALRGEARDFYSGSPGYNLPAISGGQHNVAISGGFVVRFH